jgi:hypothetical protein
LNVPPNDEQNTEKSSPRLKQDYGCNTSDNDDGNDRNHYCDGRDPISPFIASRIFCSVEDSSDMSEISDKQEALNFSGAGVTLDAYGFCH